jgi:adenylosuccinate synthase
MAVVTVVGAQWGDEGKGKVIDQLGARVHLRVRYAGGANLVETMVAQGEWLVFHLLPAAALRNGMSCLLAQGMAIDPIALLDELAALRSVGAMNGTLFVCERAQVVLPHHQLLDALRKEPIGASGTARRGIGPCYADKVARRGVQIADLLRPDAFRARVAESMEAAAPTIRALGGEVPSVGPVVETYLSRVDELRPLIVDGSKTILRFAREGKNVVFEGLLGTMVDIDHGHYPFVVGASTVASAAPNGGGVPPQLVDEVIGVAKAYSTRAGPGPFPVELTGDLADHLSRVGREVGAATGHPRRCGMFGAPELRYAARINGFRKLALTKLDVLTGIQEIPFCVGYERDGEVFDEPPFEGASRARPLVEMLPGWTEPLDECRRFEDLPQNAQRYVRMIEETSGVKVASIGVGPDPAQTIVIEDLLPG